MKFIDLRIFKTPGCYYCEYPLYGYSFGKDLRPFWSMKFYPETWHIPMNPDLIK